MGATKMFTPYDLRPTIAITEYILASLSTLVVAIRFYSRIWVVGRLKPSDYIMGTALLFTWGLCVCNHYQLKFGSGSEGRLKPPPNLNPEEAEARMKQLLFGSAVSWYAYHIGYLFIMFLIKLSILVFYLSFATYKTFRRLVIGMIVIVTAVTILSIFIIAFQCPKVPSYAFSPAILRERGVRHCFDLRIVFYWQSAFSMASDVVILLMPMPLLISLRMDKTQRFLLLAVFSVSLLIPIASGVRFWAVYLWANSGLHAKYYGGYIIFWSQVEINTAIICASAPSFQPLLKRLFDDFSRFQRCRGPYYYYGGRNSLPVLPVAEIERSADRDRTSVLESPVPAHCTAKQRAHDDVRAQVILLRSTEEELRARIRAFSYGSPVQPASPSAQPSLSSSHRASVT